jgi:hypothetical protein
LRGYIFSAEQVPPFLNLTGKVRNYSIRNSLREVLESKKWKNPYLQVKQFILLVRRFLLLLVRIVTGKEISRYLKYGINVKRNPRLEDNR